MTVQTDDPRDRVDTLTTEKLIALLLSNGGSVGIHINDEPNGFFLFEDANQDEFAQHCADYVRQHQELGERWGDGPIQMTIYGQDFTGFLQLRPDSPSQ